MLLPHLFQDSGAEVDMKVFSILPVLIAAVTAVSIFYDESIGNPAIGLDQGACSDGPNGLASSNARPDYKHCALLEADIAIRMDNPRKRSRLSLHRCQ